MILHLKVDFGNFPIPRKLEVQIKGNSSLVAEVNFILFDTRALSFEHHLDRIKEMLNDNSETSVIEYATEYGLKQVNKISKSIDFIAYIEKFYVIPAYRKRGVGSWALRNLDKILFEMFNLENVLITTLVQPQAQEQSEIHPTATINTYNKLEQDSFVKLLLKYNFIVIKTPESNQILKPILCAKFSSLSDMRFSSF